MASRSDATASDGDVYSVVEGLSLPQIDTQCLALMNTTNGVDAMHAIGGEGAGSGASALPTNADSIAAGLARVP